MHSPSTRWLRPLQAGRPTRHHHHGGPSMVWVHGVPPPAAAPALKTDGRCLHDVTPSRSLAQSDCRRACGAQPLPGTPDSTGSSSSRPRHGWAGHGQRRDLPVSPCPPPQQGADVPMVQGVRMCLCLRLACACAAAHLGSMPAATPAGLPGSSRCQTLTCGQPQASSG